MKLSALRVVPALLTAAAIGLATGCADEETGTPITTAENPTTAQPTGPSTSTDPSAAGVASVEPCSLLTDTEVTQLGDFKLPPTEENLGGARVCGWDPDRTDASSMPSIGFAVRDNLGVDEVTDSGNGIRHGKTGSGRAVAQTSSADSCVIALAVGDSARVDVVVTGVDESEACTLADQLADIIDPKLPTA